LLFDLKRIGGKDCKVCQIHFVIVVDIPLEHATGFLLTGLQLKRQIPGYIFGKFLRCAADKHGFIHSQRNGRPDGAIHIVHLQNARRIIIKELLARFPVPWILVLCLVMDISSTEPVNATPRTMRRLWQSLIISAQSVYIFKGQP
jgi:hypothetical protein